MPRYGVIMRDFIHLHNHTSYSLLDGAIRVKDLIKKAKEAGMPAVAITDNGNMYGAIEFYKKAKEAGIKPIIGAEVYVAEKDRFDHSTRKAYTLVLLAKNEEGYKNLTFLVSMSHLEGFYYIPRIDKELLKERSAGLIGLSGNLNGEIPQAILKYGYEKGAEVAKDYASLFDKDSFYLEVLPTGTTEQEQVNFGIKRISTSTGIPVVAANDCHFINPQDNAAHDVLICIKDKRSIHDEKRIKREPSLYFKSKEEMNEYFSNWPEVLDNSVKIAEQCNISLTLGKVFLPKYPVPEGCTLDSYLEDKAKLGLEQRIIKDKISNSLIPEYKQRLDYELAVIKKMGFSGYFLIVSDFIGWSKDNNIPVGPGRGSGAGSLVAYSLRITDIDPIKFKLLFERFLNPDRVSMPDFDVDFCMNKRDMVINYVISKYGADNVSQIGTFHQLKSRGTIRDVARAIGIALSDADYIAKLVPEPKQGRAPTIDQALEQEERLRDKYNENIAFKELIDYARALEGLHRHVGMHAAGVLIADNPIWDYSPCFKGDNGEIVSQYSMGDAEAVGLIKFDFLGLKTLTVIDTAVKIINSTKKPGEELFDISTIPLDDHDVFKMIADGDTTGVFQLESQGMREMLKKLKPDHIEDIVAAVALYRPGPLQGGMVDDFIDRKHGKKRVVYPHPSLEKPLKDTYGVIVYQEQVMEIAKILSGYSLGQADLLRRAMGKKKPEEMAKQKEMFISGAINNGIDKQLAAHIFDLLEQFADYGFNRSHSAAYGMITYQTAYLKKHFPNEFMAGLMSCDKDNTDNIVKFITESKAMNLNILPPDLNESDLDFTVHSDGDKKYIRFGLGAVKGVGEGAVLALIKARAESRYKSLYEFCNRVDKTKVNRRVLEALIKAGALDSIGKIKGLNRAQMLASLDAALSKKGKNKTDRQVSIFDTGKIAEPEETYPQVEEWPPQILLSNEKESLGFYVTGHPLDSFKIDIKKYSNATTAQLEDFADTGHRVKIGGVVTEYKEKTTKAGTGKVGFFRLEDQYGGVEAVVFPKNINKLRAALTSEEPVLVTGLIKNDSLEEDNVAYKLFVEHCITMLNARAENITRLNIPVARVDFTEDFFNKLKNLLMKYPGDCNVFLYLNGQSTLTTIKLDDILVSPSDELIRYLHKELNVTNVSMR